MRRTTVMALALFIGLPCTLMAGCVPNPLTEECDDSVLQLGSSAYSVTVQYRVEVVDTGGAPVDGAMTQTPKVVPVGP